MDFNSFKNKFEKVPVAEYDNAVTTIPLVSVCVQTYQHVGFIAECLDSILTQQTNFPFEIILGDDDSVDGTKLICEDYANNYPEQIRLFSHKRENNISIKGIASGRFNMIYNLYSSNGKYIAICEGDDYWTDPLKLQKQVDLLDANPHLVCCHHWQKYAFLKDGGFIEVDAPIKNQGYYPLSKTSVDKIFSNHLRIKSRTIMFRNIIDNEFFPSWINKVAFGDVPLTFLLGKHGDFGFINEPMAVYRQTETGVSKTGLQELGREGFTVQHFKNWIEIWDKADRFYNYEYHKESEQTILYFFNPIIKNLPDSYKAYKALLKYNIFERDISFFKTIPHSIFIIKKGFPVLKKNLRKLIKSLI
ncbi:MAG: glycosyltransferase involved in cell wall biosynthesis [Psychroserpens sp.]|jgi:glycosyltransferase involved in cell wall biosynthesis